MRRQYLRPHGCDEDSDLLKARVLSTVCRLNGDDEHDAGFIIEVLQHKQGIAVSLCR
jgi:hypothetical protein